MLFRSAGAEDRITTIASRACADAAADHCVRATIAEAQAGALGVIGAMRSQLADAYRAAASQRARAHPAEARSGQPAGPLAGQVFCARPAYSCRDAEHFMRAERTLVDRLVGRAVDQAALADAVLDRLSALPETTDARPAQGPSVEDASRQEPLPEPLDARGIVVVAHEVVVEAYALAERHLLGMQVAAGGSLDAERSA